MKNRNYWIPLIAVIGGVFLLTSCGNKEVQKATKTEPEKEVTISSDVSKPTDRVLFKTSMGEIEFQLYPDKAPVSVKNFIEYVKSGFYNGTIFHRVIPGFMIQGGGLTAGLQRKQTRAPIVNEAVNGLQNLRGTLSYARLPSIDSATSQFFINLVDNTRLDHRNTTPDGYGYAVFGKVVRGMDVVDAIAAVETGSQRGMDDVPVKPVVIESAGIVSETQ